MNQYEQCFLKKMKIKIIIPKHPKKDKWGVIINKGRPKLISSATYVFVYLERKVSSSLRTKVGGKIYILVDYDQLHTLGTKNLKYDDRAGETGCEWFNDIESNSKDELMYAVTCFLEDYLTMNSQKVKYKQYGGNL